VIPPSSDTLSAQDYSTDRPGRAHVVTTTGFPFSNLNTTTPYSRSSAKMYVPSTAKSVSFRVPNPKLSAVIGGLLIKLPS
jgi:hypothetical protein